MHSVGIDGRRLQVVLPGILHDLQERGEEKVAELLAEILQSCGIYEPANRKVLAPIQTRSVRKVVDPPEQVGKRIIRTKRVLEKMGWSRTTLWRRVRSGDFPRPIRLGPNMNGWLEEAIDNKISALAAEAAE